MRFSCHTCARNLFPLFMMGISGTLHAQGFPKDSSNVIADTTLIKPYHKELTLRFFFSQKYTAIFIKSPQLTGDLQYRPNTTLNMGIGASYRYASLNLAYGFPFMNSDKEKGKTKYLDLQSHLYPGNMTIDFNGQLYKGYYAFPKGRAAAKEDPYYLRPDLGVSLFGLTMYKLTNKNRFSFRMGMIQTEWQQRSSGTWLIGGEVYGGSVSGDSAFIPTVLNNDRGGQAIHKLRFLELGPGGGYAYLLVIKKHFFIMGSGVMNLTVDFSRVYGSEGVKDQWNLRPNLLYRAVVGYANRYWNLNGSWVGNRIMVKGSDDLYYFRTGNFRLTLARRIKPGPKLANKLRILDPKP